MHYFVIIIIDRIHIELVISAISNDFLVCKSNPKICIVNPGYLVYFLDVVTLYIMLFGFIVSMAPNVQIDVIWC